MVVRKEGSKYSQSCIKKEHLRKKSKCELGFDFCNLTLTTLKTTYISSLYSNPIAALVLFSLFKLSFLIKRHLSFIRIRSINHSIGVVVSAWVVCISILTTHSIAHLSKLLKCRFMSVCFVSYMLLLIVLFNISWKDLTSALNFI